MLFCQKYSLAQAVTVKGLGCGRIDVHIITEILKDNHVGKRIQTAGVLTGDSDLLNAFWRQRC